MITISYEQFQMRVRQHRREINKILLKDLPIIIGKEAKDVFSKNFHKQAWGRKPWQEVQRRQSWTRAHAYAKEHHPARTSRRILTGDTGDLGRSLEYNAETGKVTVSSDLVYAAVHNYGLRAGRGSGFTMPQRQFIGEDPELLKKIHDIINTKLNKLFKS